MKNKFIKKEEIQKHRIWFILGFSLITFYVVVNNLAVVLPIGSFLITLLKPLIIAIAIAFILNIPMTLIENLIKKRVKKNGFLYKRVRGIAITLTIIFAIIVVTLIISIMVPRILDSLMLLFGNLGSFFQSIIHNVDKLFIALDIDYRLENLSQVENLLNMPWDDIFKNFITFLGNSANGIIENTTSIIGVVFQWFMAFMFSLYLLNGKETLLRQVREITIVVIHKEPAKVLFRYASRANKIFKGFVTGQLTEAVIISVLYYIGMRLFGFPYPELIAMIIGLFSLVPVFGPMCAMGVGALLVFSLDPIQALWFIIFFQILSQIEDNLIYPRVVGNSVGLPGLWVMLSIFILGDLFGIVGMIIAVPTTALCYSVVGDVVHHVLKKRRIQVDHEGNMKELSE